MSQISEEQKQQVLQHLMQLPISLPVISHAVGGYITNRMMIDIDNDPTLEDDREALMEIIKKCEGYIQDFQADLIQQSTQTPG